jgi:hypothetical protein
MHGRFRRVAAAESLADIMVVLPKGYRDFTFALELRQIRPN